MHRLGLNNGPGHLKELAAELHRVSGPDGLEHLNKLVGTAATSLERGSHSIMLVLGPTLAKAHSQPTSREHIQGCQPPGQHNRVVIRHI